ncbi:hypothetical protein CF326_g2145 [Tilletia indica]|nr:hypothetical protein CF326_g2145 [Tilletia indica]
MSSVPRISTPFGSPTSSPAAHDLPDDDEAIAIPPPAHYDDLENAEADRPQQVSERQPEDGRASLNIDGIAEAGDPAAMNAPPQDDQLGGLDVSNATREQLAAFAAQFSAALVNSLPEPLASSSSAAFEVTPSSAPIINETLSSAAFSMDFARAAAGDAAFGVLTANAQTEGATGSNSSPHIGTSASALQPPLPAPDPNIQIPERDLMNTPSSAKKGKAAERVDSSTGEAPKKKRRTNKPRSRPSKSKEQADTEKKGRKPRRLKYAAVTSTLVDDTKTLEGIGKMWAQNDDKKKLVPLTELFTRVWLQEKYRAAEGTEIGRKKVLEGYQRDCEAYGVTGMNESALGRAVHAEFPHVGTRRLGKRGESAYFYTGIYPKDTPLPEASGSALTSEPVASEPPSSRRRKGANKMDAGEGRSQHSSDHLKPPPPPPPAAYSTNPPQLIVAKPSVPAYAVSNARSAASGSRTLGESPGLEGPSDVAASALFMMNQGVMPLSHPTHYTSNVEAQESPAPAPAPPPPRTSSRRTQPGLVAQRATTSARAAPQDRSEFPVSESIFAPRKRDPDAPPRKPRKPSARKKKDKDKEQGPDGDAQDRDEQPPALNDAVRADEDQVQVQVDADTIQQSAEAAAALATHNDGLGSQVSMDGEETSEPMQDIDVIDPALRAMTNQTITSPSPSE